MVSSKKVMQGVLCALLAVVLALVLLVRVKVIYAANLTPSASPAPSFDVLASTVIRTPDPTNPSIAQTPVVTPNPKGLPRIDLSSWQYKLASAANPIGDYAPPELTELEWYNAFDSRAAVSLMNFVEAGRAEGLTVVMQSTYRSYDEQNYIFNQKVQELGGDAERAATIVLPAGTSEHQLGLCADLTDGNYSVLTQDLENTATYQWLLAHCAEYGFILRYPADKEDITGVIYEPWHFRYVGEEAAAYIMEHGLCLEEFLALYDE